MTFQERFTEACSTQKFKPYELIQGPDAGYLVWEVQHVRNGQQVTIDGPYFTEKEARVSADLMRGAFRGARATFEARKISVRVSLDFKAKATSSLPL